MTTKTNSAFIDTNVIQKIGGYKGEELLSKILCSFGYNLYIHEYVMEEELIFGDDALKQLNKMVKQRDIVIMKVSDLSESELEEYNSAMEQLADEMEVDLNKRRNPDLGEVKSMAMAFSKDFEYFISDDRRAKVAAKRRLQKLDGSYLETIRMKDVILHIKKNQESLMIQRKIAKHLYLYDANPKLARNTSEREKLIAISEHRKKEFDEELWPVE